MRALAFLFALLAAAGAAGADEPIATYALVVGSNAGGPGQTDLRYAEDDARRFAALLVELGGHRAEHVDVVLAPTPDLLRARLAALGERVAADVAAGRPARVLFYYSGHARAAALDLGPAQLPLAELRQRLFDLPAKLTVVVLDACQSGAFSRVKGARPAADFSVSSRRQLDASGVAVLASSSSSELSQESEQLRSSYFTHHLLVGLRGAGDANRDGLVTIDEAYRYAYHQTLLATAETAVGGQHVSLEVDLKGHGEVPLSYPRAATTVIELPASLEGKTLVEDRRARAVVAEIYKARGAPVRIAVAPGEYHVIVRRGDTLSRCEVSGGGGVELDRCRTETLVAARAKGAGLARPRRIEVLGRLGGERADAYTETLTAFGYEQQWFPLSGGLTVSGLRRVHDQVWAGLAASYDTAPAWERTTDGLHPLRFGWTTYTLTAAARAEAPLSVIGGRPRVSAYAQLAGGVGLGRTLHRDQDDVATTRTFLGPAFSLGTGLVFGGADSGLIADGVGVSLGYQLDYAPVIENLVGDTHASGGHRITAAASYSF